ncbi:hypothetical protein Aperf_G00000017227 [Anoplocephala perfoliata]
MQYEQNTINRLQTEVSQVQKKTYTNWINIYLKPCNMEVTDLYTDLCDGKRLLQLLEVISNAKLGKPNRGVLRVQKMENVGRALDFIKSKVHLENIGAEDIVDGNPTLILGLIWTIILRFQIEEVMLKIEPEQITAQRSAKDALLLWCQNRTKGYQNVDIKDFSSSWRDGLAFAALLHSYEHEALDITKLRPDRPIENLTISFKVAEDYFEIPRMLDPQDVNVPKPDQRSIMTYVSAMYQMLNKYRNKNKNANRVGKTINQAIDLSSKINQYEVGIRGLLQWIRNKTAFFQQSSQNLPASLDEITKALSNFTQYRRVEKSQKYEERAKLEETLFTINLLTKELRARTYAPTDSQLKLATINSAWETLLHAEHGYEEAIRNEYLKLEKYDRLVRKFEHKAALREDWLAEMEDLSERLQKEPGTQAGSARKAEALRVEIESKEKRFRELDTLASDIGKYKEYPQGSFVQQHNAKIQSRWSALSGPKMRALLTRLAFPQTRADLMEQLELMMNKTRELEIQLTQPTKGELEFKKSGEKTIPLEVIQAALDRHRLAEAEFSPLERNIFKIRNDAEKMWANAPPMPNAESEKANDFQKCQAALDLWNSVAERSRGRKAKLDGINSSYSLSDSLTNELNWATSKIEFLNSTVSQTRDPQNARDLKLAQRLFKKHQAMESEVKARESVWEDVKRNAEQFLSTRPANSGGTSDDSSNDPLADTHQSIRSQVANITSAWNQLQQKMKLRQDALNECLESAQFYADADEASRWIQEKIHLVESAGVLRHPVESDQELDKAIAMCGPDSSSTMAQKRRLTNLETEMNAFQSNDLQRLKYYSTVLRKPTDSNLLRPELLKQKSEADGSDIDSDNEAPAGGRQTAEVPSKNTEGRAQATARYTAKDPAGRDIDLEEGEMVAVIACTNADWWHVRRNVRGQRNEGFVPANRLKLLVAPDAGKTGSNADALKAVKREATRGLSIRRTPSARTSSQLHFDSENIQKREQRVNDEFGQLQKCVKARDNCLQDTLAWHDFSMKCNNFKVWTAQKMDQLERDNRNIKNHGVDGTQIETTIEELSKGAPLLAEINELADILIGNVRPSERSLYKRDSGDVFYKKPTERRMREIQNQWEELNKRKASLEACLTSFGSLGQFEKMAETLEILLGDRILQLEGMPSSAPNKATNEELLRRVKAIKVEMPALEEKMSRLRSTGNNVAQNHRNDASTVKSRLQGIDKLWFKLQGLLKDRENTYGTAAEEMNFREKVGDLEGKLNEAEEQIGTLEPTGEIVANKTLFQSLLPPDILTERLRKANSLDDDLNVYDAAALELCDQAKRLPDSCASKGNLRSVTDGLALKNEKLKRDLEGKMDNLSKAIKAQNFAAALDTIEANIREQDTRLQMAEPLTSTTDVGREKRRIEKIKIELMKNITSTSVNEERIEAAAFPKDLEEPLMRRCNSIRGLAKGVMQRAGAREAEIGKVNVHANFHDDASDLEEWLEEKKAAVENVPTEVSGPNHMENLRQIRGRKKKLEDIDSELVANKKAVDDLGDRSRQLPSCSEAANFPDPQKRAQGINNMVRNLRISIGNKLKDLSKAESNEQFNNDADQMIKASVAATQQSAAPPEAIRPSQLPRNYAEAVSALNDAKKRRQALADELAKLKSLEEKAKAAGALTPELAAQINRERERLMRQLGGMDDEVKRNEDLVDWFKTVDEMEMLKDWADAQSGQVQSDLRKKSTFRSAQDQEAQRKMHERLREEKKLKDPRVQQLLDVKRRPIPTCLAGDGVAEQVRPNLTRSWANLQSSIDSRSRQLDDAAYNLNLLGEMSDLTKDVNSKSADVDRLVNVKSRQAVDSAVKKLTDIDKYTKDIEPKVADIDARVKKSLASTSLDSNLGKSLKTSCEELDGALGDLKDKTNSAKRSLFFQKRIFDFDEKADDQQHDITNALAFVSAVDIGDDSEQVEKLKNRWQVFLADLPKLVNRVDGCLTEGRDLSNDLEAMTNPKQISKTTKPGNGAFGLTIGEMATQPQSMYPLCNDQSVKNGADQVRIQTDCLARDKGLLQDQVRLVQSRIDHTDDISRFGQSWSDLMEVIRNRSAQLTALNDVKPKSLSTLADQIKKHEVLETELVSLQQQVDDVTSEGQGLLSFLQGSKHQGGQRNSKAETLISDRLKQLMTAWKELNAKMIDRRTCLNQSSRYLQFCEEVRAFLFWCNETENEVSSIESTAKAVADAFGMLEQKQVNGHMNGSQKVPESIDCSQAELMQANCFRMSEDLQQHWKPISMQLVAEAETMIDENHYAASDASLFLQFFVIFASILVNHLSLSVLQLKNKVDQMVVAQRRAEDGLKDYNRWILQILDLLLLKREISKFTSQVAVQQARIEAIQRECSSLPTNSRYASCDKLESSLDVTSMMKRTENITKLMQSNDDKITSLASSANLMIQKKHFASQQIHDVVNRTQIDRSNVMEACTNQMESLKRRLEQVGWEEDAEEVEAWLTEREGELNSILKTMPSQQTRSQPGGKKGSVNSGEDAVRTQLEILQRQDKFQTTVSGNAEHIEDLLKRGAKLAEMEEKIAGKGESQVGKRISSRCYNINTRWRNLKAALVSASTALEASRDLLRYQNEADALEGWLREKDILLAKGDFGSDYDHCIAMKEKINEPAAGKIVNDASIREFQSLSNRISQALHNPAPGSHGSVAALNRETADYVDNRTSDICSRWRRVQESLGKYAGQLEQAAKIHEVTSKVDGLLVQINDKKTKASARDDLKKSLSVNELEGLLRNLQANERDVAAIETQTKVVKEEANKVINSFVSNASNSQTSDVVRSINVKMDRLEATTKETKVLQKERRDLLESKLAAQRILEDCHQLQDWSNTVVKELQPQVVSTAMVGLVGKLAASKSNTSGIPEDEKRRAFVVRMRRRLTDCQSELPLRQQQLTRLQAQAQQLKPDTMERKAVPNELNQANAALTKAADVLAKLEIQVNLEEKRQAFAAAGKQEDHWLDSVQIQAQQAVKSTFRGLATDSDSADEEPAIVASTNGVQVYAAPPSEISSQSCLAMLDSLASSLEDRNTVRTQFDELQKYSSSKEAKEIYTPDKLKEDRKLLDETQTKASETRQMVARMRAQVEARTECDNWFVSANESLQWMRDNQLLAANTYDWRVVMKRYGERVPGSENDQTCGPKGSGGMARKMAAHRRFLVDIDVGLEMVERLCEKGQELTRANPKKANKIKQTIQDLQKATSQLRDTCAVRSTRLDEANELVKWGQLMDEALETAKQTEAQMMSDNYQMGENGLKRLLEKQETIAKDIQETQKARADGLLKTAVEAEKKGHFAGPKMVAEAKELAETVNVSLPQLAQARLDAIELMIKWRRLEKDLSVEDAWLKEQLNSPMLDLHSSDLQNLNYESATRHLKSLSELASRLAAQSPRIDEIVNGIRKLTMDDSRKVKSDLNDLGTLQEASRSANQLMAQRSELESRIGVVGQYLIAKHMYLQYVYDIQEAQEWIKAHLQPVSKLAPMTDSSGTKAALQNVVRLRGDATAFLRNTIGPLSARLQQRSLATDDGDKSKDDKLAKEGRTQALVGDDLRKLTVKYHNAGEPQLEKDTQANLNREVAELMKNYDVLASYLELIELRLKLRIGMNAYNLQGDEFNKFLAGLDNDIYSKEYGVDLEECEAILGKFSEHLESMSNSGASQLTNFTKSAQSLDEIANDLMSKIDIEEQRVKKANIPESQGWLPVSRELNQLRGGVQSDMRTVQERQAEVTQKWATARTGMKRRKENLQSSMQVHAYMSDVDDLLDWISEKTPEARKNQMGAALLGRMSSLKAKRPEINIQSSSGLEKALNEQEKLRREVNAMQKQVDKQEQECNRLKQELPDRASEVETQWNRLQTSWDGLQKAVGAERQRLSEADRVTRWQNQCGLLCGWADERRFAMLATRDIPTDLVEAQNLVDLHRQTRSQISKRSPEKEEIIRSGQDLSNSIPSSKIVIQKSIEKLETAWSQMQSTWSSRNSLYEKNLDLRKLYAEMTELNAWLDDQEQRLEQTTNITVANSSLASVEKAMANQADIEKAVEDAQQRFEAIKRQTLVETLKFEMLKLMTKREGSNAGDQPFSNARIAEIQRRETSKLNRNRSRRAAPAVNPTEKQTQENLKAIFGNMAPIEPSVEVIQQHAVPMTLEIPPAVNHSDSFGMTNAQFIRRVSESSDIDSPTSEKPRTPTMKRSSPEPPSPSQRGRFMGMFKRNNPSPPNVLRTNSSISNNNNNSSTTIIVPNSHTDIPRDSSSRLSTGGRAAKFFSKMRGHAGEEIASPSSLVSPTSPETPKTERIVSLPPPVPTTPIITPKVDTRSSNQNADRYNRIQSTHEAGFASRELPPRSSYHASSREYDTSSQRDLPTSPANEVRKTENSRSSYLVSSREYDTSSQRDLPTSPANEVRKTENSRSSYLVSSREYYASGHRDLPTSPTNEARNNLTSNDRNSLVSPTRAVGIEKPDFMGFLARKVQSAPRSYRGLTKKWIPINAQMASFNWAVLEGSRLNFYENEGAPTLGTAPLAVFNVYNSTVMTCPPKTSRTYNNVLQLTLEDGTEILLASNNLENCNLWFTHLKNASRTSPPSSTLVRGYNSLSRSSSSQRDSGSHGTWSLPRSGSLNRRESRESGRHSGGWGILSRRHRDSTEGKK